ADGGPRTSPCLAAKVHACRRAFVGPRTGRGEAADADHRDGCILGRGRAADRAVRPCRPRPCWQCLRHRAWADPGPRRCPRAQGESGAPALRLPPPRARGGCGRGPRRRNGLAVRTLDPDRARAMETLCELIVPGSSRVGPVVYVDALLTGMPPEVRAGALAS